WSARPIFATVTDGSHPRPGSVLSTQSGIGHARCVMATSSNTLPPLDLIVEGTCRQVHDEAMLHGVAEGRRIWGRRCVLPSRSSDPTLAWCCTRAWMTRDRLGDRQLCHRFSGQRCRRHTTYTIGPDRAVLLSRHRLAMVRWYEFRSAPALDR